MFQVATFYASIPDDGPQLGNEETRKIFQKNFFDEFKVHAPHRHMARDCSSTNRGRTFAQFGARPWRGRAKSKPLTACMLTFCVCEQKMLSNKTDDDLGIKSFKLCDFTPIREYLDQQKVRHPFAYPSSRHLPAFRSR